MNKDTRAYNDMQSADDKAICDLLAKIIGNNLPAAEDKLWHRHPVWFLDGNPIVGYSKLKAGIRLMFCSGASVDEEKSKPGSGKFKDASILFKSVDQVNAGELKRWLEKSCVIQWDYKNIVKRRGGLERLK